MLTPFACPISVLAISYIVHGNLHDPVFELGMPDLRTAHPPKRDIVIRVHCIPPPLQKYCVQRRVTSSKKKINSKDAREKVQCRHIRCLEVPKLEVKSQISTKLCSKSTWKGPPINRVRALLRARKLSVVPNTTGRSHTLLASSSSKELITKIAHLSLSDGSVRECFPNHRCHEG